MSSSVVDVVPPGSLDRWGLSITTASRDADNPRAGAMYDPRTFAAGAPVHFHPVSGRTYLALFDGYWPTGTPSATVAGRYTTHSELARPSAVMVDAASGDVAVPLGMNSFALPLSAYGSVRLMDATSTSTFLLTLLLADGVPVIAQYRLTTEAQVVPMHEYVVPAIVTAAGDTVLFDKGIYVDGAWVYLWGTDTADRVYGARQYLGKLGNPWIYQSDTGWTDRVQDTGRTHATPVLGLSSVGPVSTAVWRRRTFVGVVAVSGSNRLGQVWASRSMSEPWVKLYEHVIDFGANWTGNGLGLQPQVSVHPAALPEGVLNAIPLVSTTRLTGGTGEGLAVTWDLLPIPATMA